MVDLYVGLAIIGGLSVTAFWLACVVSRSVPRSAADLAAFVLLVGMYGYILFAWDNIRMARWLPFSNLVVVGNWFPIAAGFLGGLAWRRIPGHWVRKTLAVTALMSAAGYSAIAPLIGTPPECNDWWDANQTCVQSTPQTCSPACAATLLRLHGITTTEQEMADLCLTREGTTWVGLYRGLKLKTAGTPLHVEVIECEPADVLAMREPAIISVGLDAKDSSLELRREWGWIPGVDHSVVFVGTTTPSGLIVADPAPGYGQERWSRENFSMLFRGLAIRLVERP